MAWGMMAWHRCPTLLSTSLPRAGDFSYWGRGRVGAGRGRAIYGWPYLWHTRKYWHYPYGTHVRGGMYGDNCGIFAGKARPAPHLIQPCPEWCVHTSLLIHRLLEVQPGSQLPTLYCTLAPCFTSAHETFISRPQHSHKNLGFNGQINCLSGHNRH